MAEVFYTSFGPKDRDDVCSRNVTIGGLLLKVSGTYSSASVFLDADTGKNTDSALIIDTVAYDATRKIVSFRLSAGTVSKIYLITVRVTLTDGRHYDQSFWQEVRHN